MSASLTSSAPPTLEKKPVKFSNLLRECALVRSGFREVNEVLV